MENIEYEQDTASDEYRRVTQECDVRTRTGTGTRVRTGTRIGTGTR